MSRFLFVVPPLAGHVNPTTAVAASLLDRGHEVAWCGPAGVLGRLLPPGSPVFPAGDADDGFGSMYHRWNDLRGAAALKFLVEEALVPLARAMLPGVRAALDRYAPDVVVVDQQALAGAVSAQARGLTWVTSATTSAEFTRPYLGFPKVEQWVRDRITDFVAEAGGCPAPPWDPRFSPHQVIIFSAPALVGELAELPAHHHLVGPALTGRPGGGDFPWQWLEADRRHLLVSLGTLNREAGGRFYAAVTEATRPMADRLQVVLAAPPDLAGDVPDHMLVRDFVPQLELLPRLDAVVTHGGHNTVCEALAHGLPMVVAPIRDDQPINARQVVEAGAGIRVRFGRARVPELREAITAVLDDPSYRDSARRVQASFAVAGGAPRAAELLGALG